MGGLAPSCDLEAILERWVKATARGDGAQAAPREILVPNAARLVTGSLAAFGPAQEIALKGLSGKHHIHRLIL